MPKPNNGNGVSTYVHEQQDARSEDGPQGIGPAVSEYARNRDKDNNGGGNDEDFTDNVITLVRDGTTVDTFTSLAEAIEAAEDGDTLQVGAGTYEEVINLDKRLTIVGEEGAILDGSSFEPTAGTQGTIQLFDGFTGGTISGLTVIAIEGGQAVVNPIGEDVNDVTLSDNVFDAGDNVSGSLIYLNPGADDFVIEGNVFEGEDLANSPLLGIEGDDIDVIDNEFGDTPGSYAKVEVFEGADNSYDDIDFFGNQGLQPDYIVFA